jgi:hypothetical protein
LDRYPAGSYVGCYWGHHVKPEVESHDIQKAVLRLLASKNKRGSMLQMEAYDAYRTISFTKGKILLHVIAEKGLATLCGLVLERRLSLHETYLLVVAIEVN